MKVYMLQNTVTGDFFRLTSVARLRWGSQEAGSAWTKRYQATKVKQELNPLTITLREYTLKPCD